MVAATLHAQILFPSPCICHQNSSEAYGGAGTLANGRYTTDLFNEPILNEGGVSVPNGSVHFSLGISCFLFMKASSVSSVSYTL